MQDLIAAVVLLHGDEEMPYANASCQGIGIQPEMTCTATQFGVAMRVGKHRAMPDTAEGRLQDLIETAKADIRAK